MLNIILIEDLFWLNRHLMQLLLLLHLLHHFYRHLIHGWLAILSHHTYWYCRISLCNLLHLLNLWLVSHRLLHKRCVLWLDACHRSRLGCFISLTFWIITLVINALIRDESVVNISIGRDYILLNFHVIWDHVQFLGGALLLFVHHCCKNGKKK